MYFDSWEKKFQIYVTLVYETLQLQTRISHFLIILPSLSLSLSLSLSPLSLSLSLSLHIYIYIYILRERERERETNGDTEASLESYIYIYIYIYPKEMCKEWFNLRINKSILINLQECSVYDTWIYKFSFRANSYNWEKNSTNLHSAIINLFQLEWQAEINLTKNEETLFVKISPT